MEIEKVKLHSMQVEMSCLASLAKYPEKLMEIIPFVKESDFFHPTHQVIYRVLTECILSSKKTNSVLLISALNQLGISSFDKEVNIEDYISSIFNLPVNKDSVKELYYEMIQYRVRRDINVLSKNLAKIATQKDSKIQDLVRACDKVYADSISNIISLQENNSQINIFADLKEVIEDIGNNPPDPTRFPFGPFEAINNLYGSLHRPGNITIIGARTSVGKTAYSMFYNIWMAEKYNWPILWQDFGEMTKLELQLRAAACLTAGEVSLSSIEDGSWRRDTAATKKIREQWSRVEKLKLCYEDVSKFDPKQILTSVRKFYYNTAGRNNKFIWCLDYLKPFDTDDFNTPEWKQMGHFIQDVKSFITGEIETNLFTSIQLNKFGITNNKSSANVDDSENSVSMSDRITQQSSHTFILRRKTNDELEKEQNMFGNLKQIPVKVRHYGRDWQRATAPVRDIDGKFKNNYVNIESRNFHFIDKGDMQDYVARYHDLFPQENPEQPPDLGAI